MKLLSLRLLALAGLALPGVAYAAEDVRVVPTIAPPAAGKGQVVFYRPGGMGPLIRCTVREDGKMIARVGSGKYLVMPAEPRAHSYTAKTEATDTVRVEVEPDETTYVKCKITMGLMAGRPNLSPSSAEEFAKLGKNLKPQDPADLAEDIAKDEAKQAKATATN
jgi:hypothetical protein